MKNRSGIINIILYLVIIALFVTSFWYSMNYRTVETSIVTDDTDEISFSWWGNDERHTYTLEGVDLFESENPGISVDCKYSVWSGYEDRNRIYMLSGDEPDVMQINYNWIRQYSPDGNGYYDLHQLSDYIDLSPYTDEELSFGTVDGKLNALPIADNAIVFFYNKDLLDQYGLSVPETWDDLFRTGEVLKPHGISVLYLNEKHLFLALSVHYEQETGKELFQEDGSFSGGTEAIREMLSFYDKLMDQGVVVPPDAANANAFANGKTAGDAMWATDAARTCDALQEAGTELAQGDPPVLAEGSTGGWYVKPATMYAIASNTAHPEAAAKLLNFMVNDADMAKLQGTEKGIPVSSKARKVLQDNDMIEGLDGEAGSYVLDHLDSMKLMNPSLEDSDLISAFIDEAEKYYYGKADLDTCTKETADAWAGILSRQ